MKKIILSTKNRGKIKEINRLFEGSDVEFVGLDAFPDVPDVVEDGETFEENALKKAREVHQYTGMTALSEDSGLEVDALGGAPGVRSARFASQTASDRENVEKLIEELRDVPREKRTARFVSVFCLFNGGEPTFFEGFVSGRIDQEPRGESGFGYDPLFIPDGYDNTFAELGSEIKNRISHRARAIEKLRGYFLNHGKQ